MRLFIGFLVPSDIKATILKLQQELGETGADCKHVEAENLHLSMSFLGETAEEEVGEIKQSISEIAKNFRKIEVVVGGAKTIPSKNFVRVVALDVNDSGMELEKIMEEIRKRIGGDVKPSHLTICRVKSTRNKDRLIDFVEKYENVEFGKMKISAIQLIESKLGKSGPEYEVIFESELQD